MVFPISRPMVTTSEGSNEYPRYIPLMLAMNLIFMPMIIPQFPPLDNAVRKIRNGAQEALTLSFAWPFDVMSFESPTRTQVKTSISVESANTDGRLRECFVIEET